MGKAGNVGAVDLSIIKIRFDLSPCIATPVILRLIITKIVFYALEKSGPDLLLGTHGHEGSIYTRCSAELETRCRRGTRSRRRRTLRFLSPSIGRICSETGGRFGHTGRGRRRYMRWSA